MQRDHVEETIGNKNNIIKSEGVTKDSLRRHPKLNTIKQTQPIQKLPNVETVPEENKSNQCWRSLGAWPPSSQPQPQDSWRIRFICVIGTVSAFCNLGIGLIGCIGTVSAFVQIGLYLRI